MFAASRESAWWPSWSAALVVLQEFFDFGMSEFLWCAKCLRFRWLFDFRRRKSTKCCSNRLSCSAGPEPRRFRALAASRSYAMQRHLAKAQSETLRGEAKRRRETRNEVDAVLCLLGASLIGAFIGAHFNQSVVLCQNLKRERIDDAAHRESGSLGCRPPSVAVESSARLCPAIGVCASRCSRRQRSCAADAACLAEHQDLIEAFAPN